MVKFFKDNLTTVIVCLAEILTGVLLLVDPHSFTAGIFMLVGVLLVLLGVVNAVAYFRAKPEDAAKEGGLAKGILLAAVGVFLVFRAESIRGAIVFLTAFFGLAMLVIGIIKVQNTVDKFRLHQKRWYWAAIAAVLTLGFGALTLFNPFGAEAVLWNFVAITLLVEAIADILALILSNPKEKPALPDESVKEVEE